MKINQKYLSIVIVILLLVIIIPSSIQSKAINNKKSTAFFDGYIDGKTEYILDGEINILPRAKVKIENSLFKVTQSDSNGNYGLHIKAPYPDGYYDVVASFEKIIEKDGKYYELLPQTKLANVNFRNSRDIVNFKLACKETQDKEKIKNSDIIDFDHKSKEIENTGKIYGHTVRSYCWSWNPIPYVKVKANFKSTRSAHDGYYSISDIPLNKEIKITASKFGYFSDTKTVTLTEENPEKYVKLDVQPIIKNSKGKSIDFLKILLSSTLFSSNTRSNFFSAFTFVS